MPRVQATKANRAMLLALVQAASTAPSSHNTQPWAFRFGHRSIELWADRTRAMPVVDPNGRELVIACGAALFALRAAAARAGFEPHVALLPRGAGSDLIARVTLDTRTVDLPEAALADALRARATWRRAFSPTELPPELPNALEEAAAAEGAWLDVVPQRQRPALAGLVTAADRIQFADPAWRREAASWLHRPSRGDGLRTRLLAGPPRRLVTAALDLGKPVARRDAELLHDAPLVAVLGTDADGTADWIAAGQALQRLLLVAARQGVQAGFLNQPCQVPQLRDQLARMLPPRGFPQMVLRLGYPDGRRPRSVRRLPEQMLRD